ncbi:hypothetical protein O2N63_05960 [Aliiroseovarius sp. KMU-50]|uniref:AAA+ family ATPase n=1 Tax=Aliiroseovarius salicola TaxID=3009082 RepID=A0ABT4W1D2_9RHOB|nr:hypothetical protein [Aliiroseovarius sp. KMU-50]MDA5093632.1 hypothetical protein [Aliiroseovarius sp. KMU-50]
MKQIAKLTVIAGLTALSFSPTVSAETESSDLKEGGELMSRGFQMLLEGLAQEMSPMAEELAEGWSQLMQEMEDLSAYHPPEVLPNGDIIIRRKYPLVPEVTPDGETEL